MRLRLFIAALGLMTVATGCSGDGGSPVRPPAAGTAPGPVSLAAATNTVCEAPTASTAAVTLPDTAGVTASLSFASYYSGASGCSNVTIRTGSAASAAAAFPSSSTRKPTALRQVASASTAPLLTITAGDGLGSNLGLTSALAGATLTTDPSLNFPDGTYNAVVTWTVAGVQFTQSLVFTAKGGVLSITGGSSLPMVFGAQSTIALYDRGVTPPGFQLFSTPTPVPTSTPTVSPTVTPLPTLPPNGPVFGTPASPNSQIGTYSYTYGGSCPGGFIGSPIGYQCSVSGQPLITQYGSAVEIDPPPGFYGVVTYTSGGFDAATATVHGCESTWSVSAGKAGGTVSIPATNPVNGPYAPGDPRCVVELSTLPFGTTTGTYYILDVYIATSQSAGVPMATGRR